MFYLHVSSIWIFQPGHVHPQHIFVNLDFQEYFVLFTRSGEPFPKQGEFLSRIQTLDGAQYIWCCLCQHLPLWLSIMKENAGLLGKVGLGGRATKRCTNNFSIAAILLWCPSSGNTKTQSMLCLDVLVQTKKIYSVFVTRLQGRCRCRIKKLFIYSFPLTIQW